MSPRQVRKDSEHVRQLVSAFWAGIVPEVAYEDEGELQALGLMHCHHRDHPKRRYDRLILRIIDPTLSKISKKSTVESLQPTRMYRTGPVRIGSIGRAQD